MPRRSATRTPQRKPRNPRKARKRRAWRLSALWPSARTRRAWWRTFRRAPTFVQVLAALTATIALGLAVNWVYQVARKPSELFFPVSGTLYKTPAQTWATYAPLFRRHATDVITPEFLAALAQVEGSGNPIVRTYWRFALTSEPFEVYRPASSAVGMYQITDGTFAEARRYCIHRNRVVEEGRWYDLGSCWFNSLYTRVVPSHAVELTSAYLDRRVAAILARHSLEAATSPQKRDLAAVIHLCGAGAASSYARRGLRLLPAQHCGAHDLRAYLATVEAMQERFARLAYSDD